MDEPAEQIRPADVARTDGDRVPRVGQRWGEGERAMGSLPVVVLGIDAQRAIEMLPTQDEGPVEALGADRLDHTFRLGIGVRRISDTR